jgi:two-component system, OmpR family, phosphate regulon sensor histidine kinase PhoR
MTQTTGTPEKKRTTSRRWAALARARLHSGRFTILTALLVIAGFAASGDVPVWIVLCGAIAVLGVAALAPRRERPSTAVGGGADQSRDDGTEPPLSALELAEALPDPVIIFDVNGSIVYANNAAGETFGELPIGLLLPLKFRSAEMQRLVAAVWAEQEPRSIEHVDRHPIERTFRVFCRTVGKNGDLALLHFKDQSELRRIDRMRADFIANASHELRTPLASISGFIETLRGPAREDERAREHFLQIMHGQTTRMARLIDDLLSLSRLEMKPLHRSGERVDVVAVMKDLVEGLSHRAADKGVVIDVHYPAAPMLVPGSRDELTQVFENLLENAIKYGSSGKAIEVTFERLAQASRPEIAVSVRDFGPGIAEEHIPRLTERFYRVDAGANAPQKGTGLGLSIVKHILTRHEGRLSIRSELGKGACFTAYLPVE